MMDALTMDFLNQPTPAILSAPTKIGDRDTQLFIEIYLTSAVLMAMLNQQVVIVMEILPSYHEFLQQAHLSLPIVEDLRCTLHKFYAFKKRFDLAKDMTDARWVAAEAQLRRLKESIVFIDAMDEFDESGETEVQS